MAGVTRERASWIGARCTQRDSGSTSASSSSGSEDAAFVAKMLVTGFAGGAAIKYGEALLPVVGWTESHPEAARALALAIVLGVPLYYALTLASGSRDPPPSPP